MALSDDARQRLTALDQAIREAGRVSHHHPADYDKPIRLFIDCYQAGDPVEPNDVERWAMEAGWTAEHARDLWEMALTVNGTVRILNEGPARDVERESRP